MGNSVCQEFAACAPGKRTLVSISGIPGLENVETTVPIYPLKAYSKCSVMETTSGRFPIRRGGPQVP